MTILYEGKYYKATSERAVPIVKMVEEVMEEHGYCMLCSEMLIPYEYDGVSCPEGADDFWMFRPAMEKYGIKNISSRWVDGLFEILNIDGVEFELY